MLKHSQEAHRQTETPSPKRDVFSTPTISMAEGGDPALMGKVRA